MLEISQQLLKKIAIFGALNDDSLAFLLEQSERVDVARNDFFFREGEWSSPGFVDSYGLADSSRWRMLLS